MTKQRIGLMVWIFGWVTGVVVWGISGCDGIETFGRAQTWNATPLLEQRQVECVDNGGGWVVLYDRNGNVSGMACVPPMTMQIVHDDE